MCHFQRQSYPVRKKGGQLRPIVRRRRLPTGPRRRASCCGRRLFHSRPAEYRPQIRGRDSPGRAAGGRSSRHRPGIAAGVCTAGRSGSRGADIRLRTTNVCGSGLSAPALWPYPMRTLRTGCIRSVRPPFLPACVVIAGGAGRAVLRPRLPGSCRTTCESKSPMSRTLSAA